MSKVKRPIKISAVDPVVGDDVADGYSVGWEWFNTVLEKLFICKSAALGAADWVEITQTGAGAVSSVNTRSGSVVLNATDIPTFIASGASHAPGAVPDPSVTAGTTKFLREDATWSIPTISDLSLEYSPVDWGYLNVGTAPTAPTGNNTIGTEFTVINNNPIKGIRVYWPSATNRTMRLELWAVADGLVKATVDVTTTGIGVYTGTFASAYTPIAAELYTNFITSMWDTINNATMIYASQTEANVGTLRTPPLNAPIRPGLVWRSFGRFVANHAMPNGAASPGRYMVEPVYA